MAVSVDSTSGGTASVGTTVTVSHTVSSGSNRVLVVCIGMEYISGGFPITSVTYNGVALTEPGGTGVIQSGLCCDLWYLVNPDVGTYNIVVTKTNSYATAVSAISLFGGSTPTNDNSTQSASGTSSSLGITAGSAGMLVDVIVTSSGTPTANGSQTAFQAHTNFTGTIDQSASYKTVTSGSQTMDWTFSSSAYAGGGFLVPEAASAFKPIASIF